MLQLKQEHQLREQLVKEGRWNEVRDMDDAQLRRQQIETKQTLTRVNTELAREGAVETHTNGDGVFSNCAPVRASERPDSSRIRQDSVSTGGDTSTVR